MIGRTSTDPYFAPGHFARRHQAASFRWCRTPYRSNLASPPMRDATASAVRYRTR